MDRNRGSKFDDRIVDALPVEDVFRPAIDRTGDHAKEILQAQGHSGPMMGLDLGHRDHDISRQQGLGQPEFGKRGE